MTPDQIIFRNAFPGYERLGWTGPWPPPERFVMVRGKQSGEVAIADPTDQSKPDVAEDIALLVAHGSEVLYFARGEYSKRDEPWPDDVMIVRCAEYLLEESPA